MACKNNEDYKIFVLDSGLNIDGHKLGVFGQFHMRYIYHEDEYWVHWKCDSIIRECAVFDASLTSKLKSDLYRSMLVWICPQCGLNRFCHQQIIFKSYDDDKILELKRKYNLLNLIDGELQDTMIKLNLKFVTTIGSLEFFRRFICHDFDMKPIGNVKLEYKMLTLADYV